MRNYKFGKNKHYKIVFQFINIQSDMSYHLLQDVSGRSLGMTVWLQTRWLSWTCPAHLSSSALIISGIVGKAAAQVIRRWTQLDQKQHCRRMFLISTSLDCVQATSPAQTACQVSIPQWQTLQLLCSKVLFYTKLHNQ